MIGTCSGPFGVIDQYESGDAYRQSGAIGSSALGDFIRCPRLFQRKHILGIVERGRYQPFIVGQAFHCKVLEPQMFVGRYAVKPPGHDGRTKAGKDWAMENDGKEHLATEEGATVNAMASAVLENPEAKELLFADGPNEQTIRLMIDRWRLPVQVRLDGWRPKLNTILDLKSTADLDKWPREMASFGYHRQAALYGHVTALGLMVDDPKFIFIVVEKQEPFRVGLFRLSQEWLARGWEEVDDGMRGLRKCLDTNEWRRDEPGIKVLEIPKWMERAG